MDLCLQQLVDKVLADLAASDEDQLINFLNILTGKSAERRVELLLVKVEGIPDQLVIIAVTVDVVESLLFLLIIQLLGKIHAIAEGAPVNLPVAWVAVHFVYSLLCDDVLEFKTLPMRNRGG